MESATVIEENLGEVECALRKRLESFPSRQDAADSLGVSRVFLWKMIKRKRPISDNVLKKLGFERRVTRIHTYVRMNND